MAEENREQSEFNMAVSYLNRLNFLFYDADNSAMSLDVYKWYHSLLALRRELSTEMKDKEYEESTNFKNNISPLINKSMESQRKKGQSDVTPELYDLLDEFEIFLRKVLKESGLQNKMSDDATKALR